ISLQRDDSARIEGLVTSLKDELEQGLLRIATADSLCQLESSISGLRNSVDVLGASVEERVQNTHSRLELLTENSHVLSDQVLEVGERLAEFEATREHLLTRSLVEVSERIDGLRLREERPPEVVEGTDVNVAVAAHRATLDRLRKMLHEVRSS